MNITRIPSMAAVIFTAGLIGQSCTSRSEESSALPFWYNTPPVSEDTFAGVGAGACLTEALSISLAELAGDITKSAPQEMSKSHTSTNDAGLEETFTEMASKRVISCIFEQVIVKSSGTFLEESIETSDSIDTVLRFIKYSIIVEYGHAGDSLDMRIFAQESVVSGEKSYHHFLSINDNGPTAVDLIKYLQDIGVGVETAQAEDRFYVLTTAAAADTSRFRPEEPSKTKGDRSSAWEFVR